MRSCYDRDQNARYSRFIWSITRFYMDFHKNVNHVEARSVRSTTQHQ